MLRGAGSNCAKAPVVLPGIRNYPWVLLKLFWEDLKTDGEFFIPLLLLWRLCWDKTGCIFWMGFALTIGSSTFLPLSFLFIRILNCGSISRYDKSRCYKLFGFSSVLLKRSKLVEAIFGFLLFKGTSLRSCTSEALRRGELICKANSGSLSCTRCSPVTSTLSASSLWASSVS